jgi:hypothetical protein
LIGSCFTSASRYGCDDEVLEVEGWEAWEGEGDGGALTSSRFTTPGRATSTICSTATDMFSWADCPDESVALTVYL